MLNNRPYDPNKQYFMLDYFDNDDAAWIRSPYLTIEEVSSKIEFLTTIGANIQDLRVLPEAFLDQKRKAQYDAKDQKYVEDTITNREFFFDYRYEGASQRYKAKSLVNA
jgi:hypothetical protein|tara:strand:- start:383 stop:709 length:327 start_codon:yes stop_codon:yes gene_type:complete